MGTALMLGAVAPPSPPVRAHLFGSASVARERVPKRRDDDDAARRDGPACRNDRAALNSDIALCWDRCAVRTRLEEG